MNIHGDKSRTRKARLFREGLSQAVCMPSDWEFPGNEVVLEREEDGSVTIRPLLRSRSPKALVRWLRKQPTLEEDMPEIEDYPAEPVDLDPGR